MYLVYGINLEQCILMLSVNSSKLFGEFLLLEQEVLTVLSLITQVE